MLPSIFVVISENNWMNLGDNMVKSLFELMLYMQATIYVVLGCFLGRTSTN